MVGPDTSMFDCVQKKHGGGIQKGVFHRGGTQGINTWWLIGLKVKNMKAFLSVFFNYYFISINGY